MLDAGALLLLGALGGSASTLAVLVIAGIVGRFIYRSWMDVDNLRNQAMSELRQENARLRLELKEERSDE